jgi:hypothetical protein
MDNHGIVAEETTGRQYVLRIDLHPLFSFVELSRASASGTDSSRSATRLTASSPLGTITAYYVYEARSSASASRNEHHPVGGVMLDLYVRR